MIKVINKKPHKKKATDEFMLILRESGYYREIPSWPEECFS